MIRSHQSPRNFRSQRGAALVVGLLLLLIITLLAVAGMNSSTMELVMAGNEQYRQNAFQAAETGIEATLANGTFIPSAPDQVTSNMPITGTTSDKYSAKVSSDLGGAPQPATFARSGMSKYSAYYFTITSQGNSLRGSQVTHTQGLAFVAPYSNSKGADQTQPPGTGGGSTGSSTLLQ